MVPAVLLLVNLGFNAPLSSSELLDAQRRRASNARAAFSAAVSDPINKDPLTSPLELVAMIAAEEHMSDPMLMPHHISSRIRSDIEQLVAPAAQRLALERSLASEVEEGGERESIAGAVTTAVRT